MHSDTNRSWFCGRCGSWQLKLATYETSCLCQRHVTFNPDGLQTHMVSRWLGNQKLRFYDDQRHMGRVATGQCQSRMHHI
eukprot:286106-Chlamydomonas_euryale.AAC.5